MPEKKFFIDQNTYAEILKEKYWVFTAGKYPQGEFTVNDLIQIAENYDTEFCEAPLWVGHPDYDKEPEALAWVKKVNAEGDKLYVNFSYIDEELIYMIERKRFKRVSVEFWKFAEKPGWYLYAIGLTNRPQIKNLKPIEFTHSGVKSVTFSEDKVIERKTVNLNCHLIFSQQQKTLIQKSNQTEMKIEDIKKFAVDRGIEIPAGANDQDVVNKVFNYVDAKTKELDEANSQIAKFNDSTKTLEEQITALNAKQIDLVVEFAITNKRATPEQKDYYTQFGVKHGIDELKLLLEAQPVQVLFNQNQVQDTKAAPGVAKFKNKDGSDMTYSDFLKEEMKNPKFADNYTKEEIEKLKAETW